MRVRPAATGDIARLMAIERASATAAHWNEREYEILLGLVNPPPQQPKSGFAGCSDPGDNLVVAHRAPHRLCLVVELAEESAAKHHAEVEAVTIAGFLAAHCVGEEWEIENIAVDPAFRRRGCGDRLLREVVRRAEDAEAEEIFLAVRESNTVARKLYEKWHFKEIGRRKGYYRDPGEDAVLLHFQCIHRTFKNG